MKLRSSTLSIFLLLAIICLSSYDDTPSGKVWTSSAEPLKEMAQIRTQINAPVFNKRRFNMADFGAINDGKTKNTAVFKKAIEACNAAGGGTVIVPEGRYLTGPIYLKSNVNLHLNKGAVIVFSQETSDYPLVKTRWEGMDCMNYSPQIYAFNEKNIAVTGEGTLDGNADKAHWWPWKGRAQYGWKKGAPNQENARKVLHQLMHDKVKPEERVFGDGHYLRPYMFQPYQCRNILLSGVTLINSPMWFISPVMCDNIVIEKLHVESKGPNTDGCDPDACKNVLIRDCYFDTGDDCIAIKSGRDEDGRGFQRPAENHIIENCVMKDGHGGVVIGSEIAGGAKNIYAVNCKMSSPDLDRLLRVKTSSSRGGIIENVFLQNIEAGTYKDAAMTFDMFYETPGNFMPVIRNFWIENVTVQDGGNYGLFINAYKSSPVKDLRILNCSINGVKTPLRINHVSGLRFHNLKINGGLIFVPDSLRHQP